MNFRAAQIRMLAYVRDRIRKGELTERGFARMIGISQPHVHNVLKGVRHLSVEMSDSILSTLHISIVDLATLEELELYLTRLKTTEFELPLLDARIGPGSSWRAGIDRRKRFPTRFPKAAIVSTLVMARVSWDPQMDATLGRSDLAILDTSERQRSQPSPIGLYAVERAGELLLRYIRPGARCYYLISDLTRDAPAQWEQLNASPSEMPAYVKARVLWIGREKDGHLPLDQRGRFLYEVIPS